jgi:hypothetical protein
MTWMPLTSQSGGPASGYEPKTRVSIAPFSLSYVVETFDPNACMLDAQCNRSASAGKCQRFTQGLNIYAKSHVQTSDGAIRADLPMQRVTFWPLLRGDTLTYINNLGLQFGVAADLVDVRGNLQLDPKLSHPAGALGLTIFYTPDGVPESGEVTIEVFSNDEPPGPYGIRHDVYAPLEGKWDSPN